MSEKSNQDQPGGCQSPHFNTTVDSPELPAWTEVEEGRFMPRRVRGSYRGRALG